MAFMLCIQIHSTSFDINTEVIKSAIISKMTMHSCECRYIGRFNDMFHPTGKILIILQETVFIHASIKFVKTDKNNSFELFLLL